MRIITCFFLMLLLFNCNTSDKGNDPAIVVNPKVDFKILLKLDEPFLMYRLVVDDSMIYLVDRQRCKINVFSKSDGQKILNFGKRGEGPQEFDSILDLHFSGDNLYVCSTNKLSIFSKAGKFIKEIKGASLYIQQTFIPYGENYITWRNDFKQIEKGNLSVVYTLLDQSLKKKKDVFQTVFKHITPRDKRKKTLNLYTHCRKGVVYEDKLYVGCTDMGFFIGVFDIDGNKLYEINRQFERVKVTSDVKEHMRNYYRGMMGNEGYKRFMSNKEIVSPEYIPAYMNFFVSNDRIYVFKFPLPGSRGMIESLLLDLEGNVLVKKSLRLDRKYKLFEEKPHTSFHNGKLYFVMPDPENQDKMAFAVFDVDAMFN